LAIATANRFITTIGAFILLNTKIQLTSLPGLIRHIQKNWHTYTAETRLPAVFVWAVTLICAMPFLLNQFGFDFRTSPVPVDWDIVPQLSANQLSDTLHFFLSGSFVHTILEWSAFCTAIFTAILAFAYFRIERDVATPVIGVALLCAGIMDAFHTLAADRLIATVAANHNLIPFTWALCRLCNALLTVIGVGIFLVFQPQKWHRSSLFVTSMSLAFGVLAYSIIHFCAVSDALPETMFPNSLVTRPWDVIPLFLYAIAGLLIYPSFYLKYPSLFSYSLIISTIPNAATQIHMAFGSTDLFDNHFNIAHFLKIVAYLVPLAGLIFDYAYTHQKIQETNQELSRRISEQDRTENALRHSEGLLKDKNQQLAQTLNELKNTQSQLIYTEKMSSLGHLVGGVAHEINNPVNFIYGNIMHAENYTHDLLSLVQLYQKQYPRSTPEIENEIDAIDLDFIKDDLPKMLTSMKFGAERIRSIVISLRNFSRLDEAELKQVNLHDGIDSTLMILNHRFNKGISIVKTYSDLPEVECYPSQLNQAWLNLLENAIDALEDLMKAYQQNPKTWPSPPLPQIIISTKLLEDRRVWIAIADNGLGIPEAVQAKVFDPFFSTKPVGQGTGLGLSMCYQIIKKHGGTIDLYSQPGQGTTVEITLPLKLLV
jgi:two-component system NtrC family sensor kinase